MHGRPDHAEDFGGHEEDLTIIGFHLTII